MTQRVKRSWWVALVILSVAVGSLTGAGVAGASGTTSPPVKEAVTGWNYGGIWAGNYRLDNGIFPVYCIKAHAYYPVGQYGSSSAPITTTAGMRIGYLINKYGSSKGADTQAAVAALVGKWFDVVNGNEKWDVISTTQRSLANTLWSEATRLAGPYKVTITLTPNAQRGTSYSASAQVLSAAGVGVGGFSLTLGASGVTVSTTSVTTNSSGVAQFSYTPLLTNSSGSYSIGATGKGAGGVVKYDPTGTGPIRQIVLGGAPLSVVSVIDPALYDPNRQVNLIKYDARDSSHTSLAGATFNLSDSSHNVVGTFTTTSAASGTTLGSLKEGSTYYLTETKAPSGYYVADPTPTSFVVAVGTSPQVVLVANTAVPTLTLSTAASSTGVLGGSSSDRIVLSGNDSEGGTIHWALYGPVGGSGPCSSVSATQWKSASVAASGDISVSSNGTFNTSSTPVTSFGCYSYFASVSVAPSGARTTSAVGQMSETVLVSAPVLATNANANYTLAGQDVYDSLEVRGLGTTSGLVSGTLFGPVVPIGGSCASVDFSHASAFASFGPLRVAGDGVSHTPTLHPSAPGCYSFSEQLTLASAQVVTSPVGQASETVLVSPVPTTTTTVPVTTTTTPLVPAGGGPTESDSPPWALLTGLLFIVLGIVGTVVRPRKEST